MDYRSSMSSSSSSSSSSAAAREASARCREYLIALAKNVALDLPEVLGDSNNSDVTAASGDSAKRSDHKEYLSSLSQQIVSLGEAQARLEKEIDTRDSVMSGVLRSMPTVTGGASSSSSSSASSSSSSSSSQVVNEAEVIKKAHKDVQAAVTAYDASSAAVVRELKTMLQPKTSRKSAGGGRGGEQEDEEVQVVNVGGAREEDFLCPYTKTRMVDPMRSTACKHRISRAGLNAMLTRRTSARCVFPGCQALWTFADSSLDADFALEVERFYRKQQKKPRTEGSGRSQQDSEDQEYTNI